MLKGFQFFQLNVKRVVYWNVFQKLYKFSYVDNNSFRLFWSLNNGLANLFFCLWTLQQNTSDVLSNGETKKKYLLFDSKRCQGKTLGCIDNLLKTQPPEKSEHCRQCEPAFCLFNLLTNFLQLLANNVKILTDEQFLTPVLVSSSLLDLSQQFLLLMNSPKLISLNFPIWSFKQIFTNISNAKSINFPFVTPSEVSFTYLT